MSYSQPENDYWSRQSDAQKSPYFNPEMDYSNMQASQLDFQTFTQDTSNYYSQPGTSKSYAEDYSKMPQYTEMLTPDYQNVTSQADDYDELPLLEELEIYPDRIWEKTLAVLNPFRSHSLADDADFLTKDSDLAGPLMYCLTLAVCLFLSGSKVAIGYIYGMTAICCIVMYFLLTLMTSRDGTFTIVGVSSILGYCLLPIVALSIIGILISLHGVFGYLLATLVVLWSSISASRLFIAMSGDHDQRPLIAYPCGLVYGVFALLILF